MLSVPLQDVRSAMSGQREALERVLSAAFPFMCRIAKLFLNDLHEAEDIAQEVSLRLERHIGKLASPEKLDGWLFRMTQNAALSYRRDRARYFDRMKPCDGQDFVFQILPDRIHPAEEPPIEESRIVRAIKGLPPIYASSLMDKHVHNMSYSEIKTKTGLSIKAMEVRLVRARKMLAKSLKIDLKRGRKRDPSIKFLTESV